MLNAIRSITSVLYFVYILSLFRDGIFIPHRYLILLPRANAVDIALLWKERERERERRAEKEEVFFSDKNNDPRCRLIN